MAQGEGKLAQQSVQQGAEYVSTALYVGDLDPSVTESQIYEIFNQIGPVVSIRLCRDAVTRRSLGYAYVNYSSSQDAARAQEALNFTQVNGKPVRIMFSYRDPSIRKSGSGNIFVKNLDKSVDNKALYDMFSSYGKILSCKVALDASNVSKGYGFVQFDTDDAAQNAIEKANGMLLHDKHLFVGPFVRRQERDNALSKFYNVFVKNLADSTTDEDLQTLFGAYGSISSAVVMKEADGKSKCFGFVNFENADDAAKAVEALNGKMFQEKELYVGRAQKKTEREAELKAKFEQERKEVEQKPQGANLYLKNLDDTVDDEKLRDIFSVFGSVTSSKVMRDMQGHSKGSGFVSFSSTEAAVRAVAVMNGRMVDGKPIYVAMAQKKEDRKARLEAQFATRVGSYAPTGPPFHSGGSGMGQQLLYGQPLLPHQPAAFGYQPQMLAGMRPGIMQMPNYFQSVPQRHNQPMSGRGFSQNQQVFQRASNFQHGPAPAVNDGERPSMSALASALASASPEQQRVMLGEQLYPLVDRLEHDHAGKITGMLLEMDQTEVLHLLESPDALNVKVSEALDVLQDAQRRLLSADLASLSLNEPLVS